MSNRSRNVLFWFATGLFILFMLLLIILYSNKFNPLSVDCYVRDAMYYIRGEKYGPMFWAFRIITEFGFLFVILFILLISFFVLKGDLRWFCLSIGTGLIYLLNIVLKVSFMRERPFVEYRWMDEASSSFPSGHSMVSSFFYGFCAFLIITELKNRKSKIILFIASIVIVLLVGLSRLVLGVHYFTDVLGGFCCGFVFLVITIFVYDYLKSKKYTGLKNYFFKKKN